MANSQKNRSPEPTVRGASGDSRRMDSNVGGQKSDRQIDTASSRGAGTRTGSPAGDKVMQKKAADRKSGR
ncbi:MAG TPA: hypothetical protein VFX49_11280 [Chloroflexota bacterium]|nr:hypothetical protein [Chloroflexota bacterium]